MKTAKEWTSEIIDYELTHYDGSYTKLIKQIQLDAMKEGMRRAVKVMSECNSIGDNEYEEYKRLSQAILTAAEQLTEKDL